MKKIERLMPNVLAENLALSKAFYTTLFNLKVAFDSDWFIHLQSGDGHLELGIIKYDNDLIPEEFRGRPNGFYITIVVDDADAIHLLAQEHQFEIQQAPINTSYGQRRLLLKDPHGNLIDVSSPIPGFTF